MACKYGHQFRAEFIVCWRIVFSFLTSVHMRNSSQLTQGTVIEAAEGFLELLFSSVKAYSEATGWERERKRGRGRRLVISRETGGQLLACFI